jgi:RNase P/RNase MRP subunit POP5
MRPTLKEKRHYMIISVSSSEKLDDSEIKNKIESCIKNFIGSLGLASAGPIFVKIKDVSGKKNNHLVLKENNLSKINDNTYIYRYLVTLSVLTKYVDYVKASLVLWKEASISVKCVGVSGTIKKSERFL